VGDCFIVCLVELRLKVLVGSLQEDLGEDLGSWAS
jgi:hypothetical protein